MVFGIDETEEYGSAERAVHRCRRRSTTSSGCFLHFCCTSRRRKQEHLVKLKFFRIKTNFEKLKKCNLKIQQQKYFKQTLSNNREVTKLKDNNFKLH